MNAVAKKLRDMHALAADACDPEFSRALLQAASEIERLEKDRDLWQSRCFGALWLVPDETTTGELREAAQRAKVLLEKTV